MNLLPLALFIYAFAFSLTKDKKDKEPEERLEDYLSPSREENPASPPQGRNESLSEEEQDRAVEDFTPITARTHSKARPIIQAPLRQAMGPIGPTGIKVPFSMSDLDSWKEIVKEYRDDPTEVVKRYELIIKNQDPDWIDIDIMLDALTETEKQLILKTARTYVQAQITAGNLPGNIDNYVPLTEPGWDPDNQNRF
ncbi:hypothetical protein llap_17888 [Limosa lapponica baueri]|uniref:Core shell protein Gag P30 domain-containing protein n=1 Tax=Limosa lapponica baueri TaxID=1758121 RepID=A0A2I0TDF7_LIMLA|nr:hypothetical protein llap_17888 [Limosa lapponica baueri]